MKRAKRGFTFIELMAASLVVLVAILAIMQVYITSIKLVMQAREMDIATDDLKDVLEAMKSASFSNLPVLFPDNGAVNANVIGGFLLNNEVIRVTYPNGTTVDPLLIQVTVSWTGRDMRLYNQVFYTLRTRGYE